MRLVMSWLTRHWGGGGRGKREGRWLQGSRKGKEEVRVRGEGGVSKKKGVMALRGKK